MTARLRQRYEKEIRPALMKELAAAWTSYSLGKPEESAAAIAWLCSDAAAFVVGHAMVIDGGQKGKGRLMRKLILLLGLLIGPFTAMGADMSNGADNFYASDKVTVQKVSFQNLQPRSTRA